LEDIIGEDLRNQYILGYHPSNKSHDARWRKIKIKLRPPKGFHLLAYTQKLVTTHPAFRFQAVTFRTWWDRL